MSLPRWFSATFFGVAALGLFDAVYLAAKHYQGVPPPCSLLNGCEVVTTSAYAVVWGVPVSIAGAIYYLCAIVLLGVFLESGDKRVAQLLLVLVSGGLLATAWFVFVQIFILHAVCLYCLVSAASTTALFILGIAFFSRQFFKGRLLKE